MFAVLLAYRIQNSKLIMIISHIKPLCNTSGVKKVQGKLNFRVCGRGNDNFSPPSQTKDQDQNPDPNPNHNPEPDTQTRPTNRTPTQTHTQSSSKQDLCARDMTAPFHPPRGYCFPVKVIQKAKRQCQPSWFSNYEWLHYDHTRDKVFCFTCALMSDKDKGKTNYRVSSAFVTDGFDNWKKGTEKFKVHEKSLIHQQYTSALAIKRGEQQPISALLNDKLRVDQEVNRRHLLQVIRCIHFAAHQGIGLQGKVKESGNLYQLVKLTNHFTGCKNDHFDYTNHNIQNEIVFLLYLDVIGQVLKVIRKHEYFAFIGDEGTDISNTEYMSIVLRTVSDELFPKEWFIGFYDVPNIKAETLYTTSKVSKNMH